MLPEGYSLRTPTSADRQALAGLMIDAYVGTIDYEGETPEQALEEVDGYLAESAYLETSLLVVSGKNVEAAAMMAWFEEVPLVAFVMTRAAAKGTGLATVLVDNVVDAVWQTGATEIRAFITEGNLASEIVFTRVGFEVVASHGE